MRKANAVLRSECVATTGELDQGMTHAVAWVAQAAFRDARNCGLIHASDLGQLTLAVSLGDQ